jgi:hypothetical protein
LDACQFDPLAFGGELIISQRYAARSKQLEIYLESFRGRISFGATFIAPNVFAFC